MSMIQFKPRAKFMLATGQFSAASQFLFDGRDVRSPTVHQSNQ